MKPAHQIALATLFATSLTAASVTLATTTAFAANTGVSVRWSYENAATGQKVKENQAIELGDSSAAMQKTLLVVKASAVITNTLAAWAKTCNDTQDNPVQPEVVARPGVRHLPGRPGPIRPPMPEQGEKFSAKCRAEKDAVMKAYKEATSGFEAQIPQIENYQYEQAVKAMQAAGERVNASLVRKQTQEPKLTNLITVLKKLAENMKNAKPEDRYLLEGYRMRSFSARSAGGGNMNVTTGGAQDAKIFRDLVTDGKVPEPSKYQAYGLINEFDLSISQNCGKYLCMSPSVAFEGKKMYVQVGLGVNVKENEFQRRPINLGVALDLSGSMEGTDKSKKTRLEWSKDALRMTLKNLVAGQDYFTLVYFSDEAKVLWSPKDGSGKARAISEQDKHDLLGIIDGLKTIGSTNLRAGLDLAYDELNSVKSLLAGQGKDDSFESRVIMITDANLNYGDTDESSAVIKVEDQSRSRGINLTTIGVGLNFFQDFINKLGIMRGANYIFAQDGQAMLEYFEQFDTLVTPYAYDFVANVAVAGNAKLVRVHGVPEVKNAAPSDSILSIKTLFLASSKKGGGAQVLEFDLE